MRSPLARAASVYLLLTLAFLIVGAVAGALGGISAAALAVFAIGPFLGIGAMVALTKLDAKQS